MLRSAARSLRLQQTLEPERCLLARRFLNSSSSCSSVPIERQCCPSLNKPLKDSMEQKYPDNIYKRLLMKADKISEGVDEHSRLIKEIQAVLKENNKNAGAINLMPWVLSISSSLVFFGLYKCFS